MRAQHELGIVLGSRGSARQLLSPDLGRANDLTIIVILSAQKRDEIRTANACRIKTQRYEFCLDLGLSYGSAE
jgi:hypothetical protein